MKERGALAAVVWVLLALQAGLVPGRQAPARDDTAARRPANAGGKTAVEKRAPGVLVISEGQRPRWQGEKITLSLKDADLTEVIRSFARLADINLVIDPTVKGSVTVELEDVPWDQALSVILKTHRLGAEIDGRILTVAPPARLLATPTP